MNVSLFGTLPDGAEVQCIEISNGRLSAKFISLGARLNALSLNGSLSFVPTHSLDEALGEALYSGVIIAPVLNRLGRSQALLDGQVLKFEPNEGQNLLHSGSESSCWANWEVASVTENSVTFRLVQRPGSFPGTRTVEATYRLDETCLVLEIAAETDAPTLMNAGFHPYWSASGEGRANQKLEIAADTCLELDQEKIPTGQIIGVSDVDQDLRNARVPEHDIDTCFILRESNQVRRAVSLISDSYRLDIDTDAPAVHVYTGNEIGIAVEPEMFPDAPNHSNFPSVRLAPGEVFQQKTIHRFTKL
ncbi:MAG: hypothetical protein OXQ92_05875 [Boseongicola sp.]|nr:hypothetical protein [Boseongicola sp.]